MSADSITADGRNRYTYVRNNPLRYNDPFGLQGQDCFMFCTGSSQNVTYNEIADDAFQGAVETALAGSVPPGYGCPECNALIELQNSGLSYEQAVAIAECGAASCGAVADQVAVVIGAGVALTLADGVLPFGDVIAIGVVGIGVTCIYVCGDAANAVDTIADGIGTMFAKKSDIRQTDAVAKRLGIPVDKRTAFHDAVHERAQAVGRNLTWKELVEAGEEVLDTPGSGDGEEGTK